MDRRDFLKLASASLFLPSSLAQAEESGNIVYAGWLNIPEYIKESQELYGSASFYSQFPELKDLHKDIKQRFLWKDFEKVTDGPLEPHHQTIGDCVSHGWGLGIDVRACTQILAGAEEQFVAKASTETLYGGSRVQIGGGRLSGDGSLGSWAAGWVTKYGNVIRDEYSGHDLRKYSGNIAKAMGRSGCPAALVPVAKEHPVLEVALVKTGKEAMDAIAAGFPVSVCSGVGFSVQRGRDSMGFMVPAGQWMHCMLSDGFDLTRSKHGVHIEQSWGPNWVSGGSDFDMPKGSFFCDLNTYDRMIKYGDSYAIMGYKGHEGDNNNNKERKYVFY